MTVTATSTALQTGEQSVVTDEAGDNRLTQLPIGTYAVSPACRGSEPVRRENIQLTVGFAATVDVELGLENFRKRSQSPRRRRSWT